MRIHDSIQGGMRWKSRNVSKRSEESRKAKKKSKPTPRLSRQERSSKKISTSSSMRSMTCLKKTPKNSSKITFKKGESDTLSLVATLSFPAILAYRHVAHRVLIILV